MSLRVAIGRAGRFVWPAPCYLTGAAVLTVQHPVAGDVQPAFAPVHAAVDIDEIEIDGRTLHLADPLALPVDLIADDAGDAFLRLPDGGVLEVTVGGVVGGTIKLADTLRREVDGVSAETPATLQWASWVAVLDGALTATALRSVPWVVTGAGLGAIGQRAIEDVGDFDVVRRPFRTGVTVGALHRHRAALADSEYRRASHQAAIDAAFDRLVTWMRTDLGPGVWEDDVFNGPDFWQVHLRLTEAELASSEEQAQLIRSDAKSLYRQKSERVRMASKTSAQAEPGEKDIGGADETHMAFGTTRRS